MCDQLSACVIRNRMQRPTVAPEGQLVKFVVQIGELVHKREVGLAGVGLKLSLSPIHLAESPMCPHAC